MRFLDSSQKMRNLNKRVAKRKCNHSKRMPTSSVRPEGTVSKQFTVMQNQDEEPKALDDDAYSGRSVKSSIPERICRFLARPPFRDERGNKGWLERFARSQPHLIRELPLRIEGWPLWPRPLRIVFVSDLHLGSHSDDLARLRALMAELQLLEPDLVLHGGDFMNMQPIGGGRIPPHIVASILGQLTGPLGQFAVLGNHDYLYDGEEVSCALRKHNISVLEDECVTIGFHDRSFDIAGIPDARARRRAAVQLLSNLQPHRPTIVLAHDPVWFADVPSGPHLTLAGHTHGGQIKFPIFGILRNASQAPLRWSYGLVVEKQSHMYVTSGIGTSGIPLRLNVPPEAVVIDLNGI
jgi:predicted MPP superfamily phosphohydrolase